MDITDDEFLIAVEETNSPAAKRIAELERALRLVMSCAVEIEDASDADLEDALKYGDIETKRQANAWIVARMALMTNTGVEL